MFWDEWTKPWDSGETASPRAGVVLERCGIKLGATFIFPSFQRNHATKEHKQNREITCNRTKGHTCPCMYVNLAVLRNSGKN